MSTKYPLPTIPRLFVIAKIKLILSRRGRLMTRQREAKKELIFTATKFPLFHLEYVILPRYRIEKWSVFSSQSEY